LCEVKVYLEKNGEKEEFMDNVITIKPEKDRLLLVDLFGSQREVQADLVELKLLEHEVIIKKRDS